MNQNSKNSQTCSANQAENSSRAASHSDSAAIHSGGAGCSTNGRISFKDTCPDMARSIAVSRESDKGAQ